MSTNNKAPITILQAIELIATATRNYVDDVNFSGDYNDLYNVPDTVVTKDDVTQATNVQVINMLSDLFDK